MTAPNDSGDFASPPHPAPRRMSGFGSGPSSLTRPRSQCRPAGRPGSLQQAALNDHALAAGCLRAPARRMLARWLTISLRPFGRRAGLGHSVPAGYIDWLPAFPRWPRQDPLIKSRLSGFLATQQGTRLVTVLLYTGATHCFSELARLRRSAFHCRLTRAPPK